MRENLIKHVLKRGQIDKARKKGRRGRKREREGREKRGSEQERSKESRRQVKWRIK